MSARRLWRAVALGPLERRLFWIVVDVLAVGVYAVKRLYPTTGLYAVFLVMAVAGWLAWRSMPRADCM